MCIRDRILTEAVAGVLEKDGYTLEVKEFTDYVQPNNVVENGEIDANYFQHQPYLDDFNAENNTHLVSVVAVHYEPVSYTHLFIQWSAFSLAKASLSLRASV